MQNYQRELWERIPHIIQSMRQNNKFNNYRYEYYPELIRGSETDTQFKNKVTIPHSNATAEAEYYYFRFYVFADDIQPRQITLEMRYEYRMIGSSLLINLNTASENGAFCFFFPWMEMYLRRESIEKILDDFEHFYLEIPLYYIHGTKLLLPPGFKIDHMYHALQNIENYQNRALAIAMAAHKRLGDDSILGSIANSRDILQTIHEYSNPYNLDFKSYLEN